MLKLQEMGQEFWEATGDATEASDDKYYKRGRSECKVVMQDEWHDDA